MIDDGPGVSPEVLPRLFEAFGPTGERMGNGLHVSREAARAQGGDLVLESTSPDGCVFALTVSERHPMKILLADDDSDIREVATHLLGRRGWDVATATTARRRWRPSLRTRYDIAVLDQNMPPGSGLEVAAERPWAGTRSRSSCGPAGVG